MKKTEYNKPEVEEISFSLEHNFVGTGNNNNTTPDPSGDINPGGYGGDD